MAQSDEGMAQAEVHECLSRLVDRMKAGDGPGMVAHMKRLDQIVSSAGETLDPRLSHFLGNRSYVKALHLLEGEGDIARGSCQPRKS
jgi:hypothetical protein